MEKHKLGETGKITPNHHHPMVCKRGEAVVFSHHGLTIDDRDDAAKGF